MLHYPLRRKYQDNLFYWTGKYEIDFVVREGKSITQIWQVVADSLDEEEVRNREIRAIKEAQSMFPSAQTYLVTKTMPSNASNLLVKVIPLWLLLMEDS